MSGYAVRKDGLGFRAIDSKNDVLENEIYSVDIPPKTNGQILAEKVAEAKQYLADTDYKDLPRYVPKDGEDMKALYLKRDEAREFIRVNS